MKGPNFQSSVQDVHINKPSAHAAMSGAQVTQNSE
jgi:hypothetical protein